MTQMSVKLFIFAQLPPATETRILNFIDRQPRKSCDEGQRVTLMIASEERKKEFDKDQRDNSEFNRLTLTTP